MRALTAVCVLILSVGSSPRAASKPDHALKSVGVVAGLRIEVTVPQAAYPRDALVPVAVSVRNVTREPIRLKARCEYGFMWVDVSNVNGKLVYPPAIEGEPKPSCSYGVPIVTLQPGAVRKRSLVVWLRGRWLRPVVSRSSGQAMGPKARLTLLAPGPAPEIQVSDQDADTGARTATVVTDHAGSGPLLAQTFSQCTEVMGTAVEVQPLMRTGWVRTTSRQLTSPSCISDVYAYSSSFQVVAGWLGQTAGYGRAP